jgi:hypothetical protein
MSKSTDSGAHTAEKSSSGVGCPRNNHIFFGSNRNKPKLNLFWLFFGLFRETKKQFFRCFGPVLKQLKQTEFSRNKPKTSTKNVLY